MDKVGGYEITKRVLFDDGQGIAMSIRPGEAAPFATWQFKEESGKRDYYGAHYFPDDERIELDFISRINYRQFMFPVQIVSVEPEKAIMGRYVYYSSHEQAYYPTPFGNDPVDVVDFTPPLSVEIEHMQAACAITYKKPLSPLLMSEYDLRASPYNPAEPCHQISALRPKAPAHESHQER